MKRLLQRGFHGTRGFRTSRPYHWNHISSLSGFDVKAALAVRGLPAVENEMKNLSNLSAFLDSEHGGSHNGLTTSCAIANAKKEIESKANRLHDNTHYTSLIHVPQELVESVKNFLNREENPCHDSKFKNMGQTQLLELSGKYKHVKQIRGQIIDKFFNSIPNLAIYCKGLRDETLKKQLFEAEGSERVLGGSDFLVEVWSAKGEELLKRICMDILPAIDDSNEIALPLLLSAQAYDTQMRNLEAKIRDSPFAKSVDVTITKFGNQPDIYQRILVRGPREAVLEASSNISAFLKKTQSELVQIEIPPDALEIFKTEKWPALESYIYSNYQIAQMELREKSLVLQHWVKSDVMKILADVDYQIQLSEIANKESMRSQQVALGKQLREFDLKEIGIGGMGDEFVKLVREAFLSRTISAQLKQELGLIHVKGVILHGLPGTGKTMIARHIGDLLSATVTYVNAPELENKYVGETEKRIASLFAPAKESAKRDAVPDLHVVIFDEIDAISRERGGPNAKARDGSVYQLLCEMDGLKKSDNIIVIGITNRLADIDKALLRSGRFETKIKVKLPTEESRLEILQILCKRIEETKRMESIDFGMVAGMTEGFSGADLEATVRLAINTSIENMRDEEHCLITNEDIENAVQEIRLTKLNVKKKRPSKQSPRQTTTQEQAKPL